MESVGFHDGDISDLIDSRTLNPRFVYVKAKESSERLSVEDFAIKLAKQFTTFYDVDINESLQMNSAFVLRETIGIGEFFQVHYPVLFKDSSGKEVDIFSKSYSCESFGFEACEVCFGPLVVVTEWRIWCSSCQERTDIIVRSIPSNESQCLLHEQHNTEGGHKH